MKLKTRAHLILSRMLLLFFLSTFLVLAPRQAVAYDPQYLKEVVGRRAVSLSDGTELIMYLLGLDRQYPTFESQIAFIKQEGWVKAKNKDLNARMPLSKGMLAYMLVKALGLKGGIKARLFGMNERFAMEELAYQDIMREGHRSDLITGIELVLIMTQAAHHLLIQEGKAS